MKRRGGNTHRAVAASVALLLCFCFCNFSIERREVMSDRVAMPLSKMIGTADLIVWGSVKTVHDSSFVLNIHKNLNGTNIQGSVEVLNVTPDKFSSQKPVPYKKDQSFILFLTKPKDFEKKSRWKTMGFGEGQMPVENDYVYFMANNIDDLKFDNYVVQGVKQYVQRFESAIFLKAVEEYTKCFRWTKISATRATPQIIGTEAQVTEFSKKSLIHSYLVKQTNALIPKK